VRKAQARAGTMARKKTAVVAEPLASMLATCTDGLRGTRDCALLLLGWSGGGRQRSELVGLRGEDLRQLDPNTWLYRLGNTLSAKSLCAARPPRHSRPGSTKARSPLARSSGGYIAATAWASVR